LCYGKPVLAQNIHLPTIILSNVPFELNWEGFSQASPENPVVIKGLSTEFFSITSPVGSAEVKIKGNTVLEYPLNQGGLERTDVTSIPGWLSLLPPLLAIVLALLTKEMLISLFAGIWVGVTIMMSSILSMASLSLWMAIS